MKQRLETIAHVGETMNISVRLGHGYKPENGKVRLKREGEANSMRNKRFLNEIINIIAYLESSYIE